MLDARFAPWIETVLSLLLRWGLRVLGALALAAAGLAVARAARSAVRRALERSGADPTLTPFVAKLVYYLVVTVVGIAVLGLFGIQTASIIAVLASAGLAVGLALQGTLSNFAAGVMLLAFRPFRVDHFVEAGGSAGTVKEIGIFTTTLATPDNVQVIVPNSAVWGGIVKNYSANDTRRNDLVMSVSYGDDVSAAIAAVRRVLGADPRVLAEPEAVVAVSELADSSVNLVVRPWCRREDYWPLRFDLTRNLKEALEAAGCTIPFPQRDVHVRGGVAGAGPGMAARTA